MTKRTMSTEVDATKSKEALEKLIREADFDKQQEAKRLKREQDEEAARRAKAEADQLAAKRNQPKEEEREKKKQADVHEFIRQNDELIASGVQGYDRFDTSLNKIIMWSKAGGVALNSTLQPWETLYKVVSGTPGAIGQLVEASGVKRGVQQLGDTFDDWQGRRQLKGPVDLHDEANDIDFTQMVTVDNQGRLQYKRFSTLDSFKEVDSKRAEMTDAVLQNSVELLLQKNGYICQEENGEKAWIKPHLDNEDAAPARLGQEDLEAALKSVYSHDDLAGFYEAVMAFDTKGSDSEPEVTSRLNFRG